MKKAAVFLCIFMAFTAFCLPARAEPFTGGSITVDVPEGWTPSFKKDNLDQLRLRAPGNAYGMVILAGSSNGMNSEQGAGMLAKKVDGTMPAPAPMHPGIYYFTAHSGTLKCLVMAQGKSMVVIMNSGNGVPFMREIGHIMHSLASTDPDEQAIFDSLKLTFPNLPKK